jgi:ribose transport system substrate-binding protein
VLVSLSVLLAATLAACGGSGSAQSSAADAAAVASVPAPVTTPPTKITLTDPLAAAPTAGKTFFWLQCSLPICAKITTGVKAAVAAAGWKYENLVFSSTDPGAGLASAIQRKPDAIGITGIPSAAVKSQLAQAAAAGIPVVSCSAGPESPSATTYPAICNHTTAPDGRDLGLWAIKNSGGTANIVSVTVPSYPSLKTTTDGLAQVIGKYCPGCSTDELDVTNDDLAGGQIAAKLVGYLQSHPKVDYVLFTFADLEIGVPQALKAAGMSSRVKLIGDGAGPAQFQGVIAGGMDAAWIAFPTEYQGWELVDAAIRLAGGGRLPSGYQAQFDSLPTYVVDDAAAARALAPAYDFPGPAGYEQQFKQLWKVG